MTADEARAVAKEAVRETLVSLGLDPDDIRETQKDMVFLRSWRESTETVKRQSIITAVIVCVTGLLGYIWFALKGG